MHLHVLNHKNSCHRILPWAFCATATSCELSHLLFTNYLQGLLAARTSLCILYVYYFMYLLLGGYSVSSTPSQTSLLVEKGTERKKCFRARRLKGFRRWFGSRVLEIGGNHKRVFSKKKKKTKKKTENTHTSSHGSPLPPAFLCKFGHDYKWEKPRGVWLHSGDGRHRECVCFCACIVLHAGVCEREKEPPYNTHVHTYMQFNHTEHTVLVTWNSK